MTDSFATHIGDNFDLFVLRFIEDVGVVEDLHERRAGFTVTVKELDELVQLRASFLKVLGKLFAASFICNDDRRASNARWKHGDGGGEE